MSGLVELCLLFPTRKVNRLQETYRAERIHIAGELRRIKRNTHMTLRRKIVDLVRLNLVDQLDEIGAVAEITIVEKQLHPIDVRILVEMVDSLGVEGRSAANNAVNLISL